MSSTLRRPYGNAVKKTLISQSEADLAALASLNKLAKRHKKTPLSMSALYARGLQLVARAAESRPESFFIAPRD
jgi:hypothetical protein